RHTRFSRDWSSDVCSSDLHRSAPGPSFGGGDRTRPPTPLRRRHLATRPQPGWAGVVRRGRRARAAVPVADAQSAQGAAVVGRSWSRRRNWALIATITVEALIKTAAAAGGRTIPAHARAPAASGIARTL